MEDTAVRTFLNLVLASLLFGFCSFLFLKILLKHLPILLLTFPYSQHPRLLKIFQFLLDTSSKSSHCFHSAVDRLAV